MKAGHSERALAAARQQARLLFDTRRKQGVPAFTKTQAKNLSMVVGFQKDAAELAADLYLDLERAASRAHS